MDSRCSLVHLILLLVALVPLAGCGATVVLPGVSVSVDPLPTDDLSGPCNYLLLDSGDTAPQTAVMVIFERGDSLAVFNDPTLRQLALDHHIALVYASQCSAKSYGDLQSDASQGPARALVMALSEFATITGHSELATAPMLLYGFSAAGALTLTMAEAIPHRILGAMAYAPGSAYFDLTELPISGGATTVPTLIMGNAGDNIVGTSRSKKYFDRGRAVSAPWSYAVQNNTGHCCNASTLNLIVPWINALATQQAASQATTVGFTCTPDGVPDSYGTIDCVFTFANIGQPTPPAQDSGWLPDSASAQAWLTWVTSLATN